MKKWFLGVFAVCAGLANGAFAADFGRIPDPYTGNWVGLLRGASGERELHAIMLANKNDFEIAFRFSSNPREEALLRVDGVEKGDELIVEAVSGIVKDGRFSGELAGPNSGSFELRRTPFPVPPSLGQEPPEGAIVLFDGSAVSAWEDRKNPGEAVRWKIDADGALEVVSHVDGKKVKQDLKTKREFGDYRLHLEFNLFHKPSAKGQGRSNSGIFHHGVYETQILDSFGQYGKDNDCGGIYKTREPDSNAGYPGGLWQTYDIELKAPRFDGAGKKTADARMTVRLNGVLIHDDVPVAKGGKEPARGPIILQDHGNPVRYRNIWVVESND